MNRIMDRVGILKDITQCQKYRCAYLIIWGRYAVGIIRWGWYILKSSLGCTKECMTYTKEGTRRKSAYHVHTFRHKE